MKKNVLDLLNDTYDKGINLNNEKTIISLCYHENIIKVIKNFNVYEKFLQNLCNGDFYDRVSFQKQLWQFNEMTYFLKVLYNYDIYKHLRLSTCRIIVKKMISGSDNIGYESESSSDSDYESDFYE